MVVESYGLHSSRARILRMACWRWRHQAIAELGDGDLRPDILAALVLRQSEGGRVERLLDRVPEISNAERRSSQALASPNELAVPRTSHELSEQNEEHVLAVRSPLLTLITVATERRMLRPC